MPTHDEEGSHNTKGGISILGKIGAYQEKTGESYKSIMKMPYLRLLIQSADFPSIDYDKKKTKKPKKQKGGFGTPISELPLDVQRQLK